jgi:hypothetical protein
MHGSKEQHTTYVYKRSSNDSNDEYVAVMIENQIHYDAQQQRQSYAPFPLQYPLSLPETATILCDRIYEMDVKLLRCGFEAVEKAILARIKEWSQINRFPGPSTRSALIRRGPPLLQKCRKRKRGGTINTTEEEEVALKDITKQKYLTQLRLLRSSCSSQYIID